MPVGQNLQDHIYPGGIHFSVNYPVTLSQERTFSPANIARYFATGSGLVYTLKISKLKLNYFLSGPLTSLGGVEGLAFINTKFANSTDDWPDFQIHLSSATITTDNGKTLRKYMGITDKVRL